jgi:hypothetical protein
MTVLSALQRRILLAEDSTLSKFNLLYTTKNSKIKMKTLLQATAMPNRFLSQSGAYCVVIDIKEPSCSTSDDVQNGIKYVSVL